MFLQINTRSNKGEFWHVKHEAAFPVGGLAKTFLNVGSDAGSRSFVSSAGRPSYRIAWLAEKISYLKSIAVKVFALETGTRS